MTSFARKLVSVAAFLSVAGAVVAQPLVWEHSIDNTNFPKMTRDSSGNIYMFYPTSSYTTFNLKLDKISPQGNLVYSKTVFTGASFSGAQFSVRRAIFAHNKVYVLFQSRNGGGNGTFNGSYVRWVDPATGNSAQILYTNGAALEALAADSVGIATAGVSTISDTARLIRLGASGGAGIGPDVDISGFNGVEDVACLPDGTAYLAASKPDGTVAILKALPNGSSTTTSFDVPSRTGEQMYRVVIDAVLGRVYGMGNGYFNGVVTDVDVVLYAMDLNSANTWTNAYGGNTIEVPGDITVIPGSGVVVSYFSDSLTPDATVVRRLSSTLTSVWTQTIPDARPAGYPSHAFDADGNLLILDAALFNEDDYVRVTKKSLSNGATLDTTMLSRQTSSTRQLLSDAAGNYFCTANQGNTAHLYRLQPAIMTFSANTVPGGQTITGKIQLPGVPATEQVWTLASSNPAAASVPSSVTVTTILSGALFDITTNPVTANTNVSISARYQGFIMQKTLTLLTPTVSALSISPNVVIGGVNTAGLVTISGAAPAGGKTVNLASSNTAAATVPASVVIPAGSTSFGFGITTFGVTANRGVVITATTGAISKTAFFAVNAPSLQSVSMNPTTIKGGLQSAMTVTLDGIAPTGGRSVVIFSGAPAIVFAPASVTVAAGQASVTQNLTTAPVTSSTNVLIFATRSGIYKTTTITVTP